MGLELITLRSLIYRRVYSEGSRNEIIDQFHRLYYDAHVLGKTWAATYWMGVPVFKSPLDLWLYQEIIHLTRPDLIIESGTAAGGSALYFAALCDLEQHGKVVTIDVEERERPIHRRITYLTGSSTSPEIVKLVKSMVKRGDKVMVDLDSAHDAAHVLNELHIYSRLVSRGNYLIVEDTNTNGHPVMPGTGEGPMEAVQRFLSQNADYRSDERMEKFLMSFNPKGYLIRVKGDTEYE